jgi:hypothetical protein
VSAREPGGGAMTSQPVTSQPVTSQPVTSQPVTSQPVASQPVTRRIFDARPQSRVDVTGAIRAAGAVRVGGGFAYRCVLSDGTGELDALFLGRTAIAGLTAGARCSVAGMAAMYGGRLVVWNPRHRLELSDGATADRRPAANRPAGRVRRAPVRQPILAELG